MSDLNLFAHAAKEDWQRLPLAARMRPQRLSELVGQEALLAESSALRSALRQNAVPSMILWGPPGTGKTTLAHCLSEQSDSRFVSFHAVMNGVPELRQVLKQAREQRDMYSKKTVLFIDEIHRFNKAQQDALLPDVEQQVVTLIGATTENPSFAVNAALLSRVVVFRLEALSEKNLIAILNRALADPNRGLGQTSLKVEQEALEKIAAMADGDARCALQLLEFAFVHAQTAGTALNLPCVEQSIQHQTLHYDKHGDEHHHLISAFIKSMRGSDPDASIYWMMRMIEAGADPLYLLRRMIIFASEDIGNADPRALQLAVAADAAFQRLGMPEGLFALSQCALYLASTAKSNASYRAWTAAQAEVHKHGSLPVPEKLRNAPTKLMRDMGYGKAYRNPHDEEGYAAEESYLPERLVGRIYYEPRLSGYEQTLHARLENLRNRKKPDT